MWETHDDVTVHSLLRTPRCSRRNVRRRVFALERFAILMYDRTRTSVSIKCETMKLLFMRKGRPMAALPPSEAALHQTIRRTALQGGVIGVLPPSHIVCYHHLVTGFGHIRINGSHCGPIFLKQVYRVQNSCIAAAGRDAQTANVHRCT